MSDLIVIHHHYDNGEEVSVEVRDIKTGEVYCGLLTHDPTYDGQQQDKCKVCGKPGARWCTDCYYEYHESKEELMGGVEDVTS